MDKFCLHKCSFTATHYTLLWSLTRRPRLHCQKATVCFTREQWSKAVMAECTKQCFWSFALFQKLCLIVSTKPCMLYAVISTAYTSRLFPPVFRGLQFEVSALCRSGSYMWRYGIWFWQKWRGSHKNAVNLTMTLNSRLFPHLEAHTDVEKTLQHLGPLQIFDLNSWARRARTTTQLLSRSHMMLFPATNTKNSKFS